MSQAIAVVTGAAGGLGSHLCAAIAGSGVKLVLVDRNAEKSRELASRLNKDHPESVLGSYSVDLSSHQDIRRMTTELLANVPSINYLFNNAGVLTETLQFSKHQNELHFEVNALAPLAIIDQLTPALRSAAPSMVVNTSAGLSLRAKTLDWEELVRPKEFKKLYGPYVKSKEALNVITAALGRELAPSGITVRAADPGPNQTALTRGAGTPMWMRLFYRLLPTPEKGANKIFLAGDKSGYGGQTGIFISGGKITALPPALRSPEVQAEFLAECRKRTQQT